MRACWTWEAGGEAVLISLQHETVVVRSTKPFAPGSRPIGVLPNGATIRLKTHRSRREEGTDGRLFTIDGRILDLTRELRTLLLEALTASNTSSS